MNSHRVVARRRWYGAFLTKVATVYYREGSLQLWDAAQQPIASIPANDIVRMRLDQHWISADLVVTTGDGTFRCRTLPLTRGRELIKAFHDDLDRVAAARPRARELTAKIEMIDQRRSALLSDSAYARYSEAEGLHNDAKGLVAQCDWYVRQCMSDTTNEALQRIEEIVVREEMETRRHRSNDQYVTRTVPLIKTTTVDFLSTGLTDEQAAAVATDEDATLVLAGAGTGKTALITAKVAHLVRNLGTAPGEILVLAYNRKAMQELRERLPGDLRDVAVHTFHSFGMRVLGQSTGKKPTISKLAEDKTQRNVAIDKIMQEMLRSPQHREQLISLLAFHRNDFQSPFEFDTEAEYYRYVQTTELRTLNGNRVRSLEEVHVANFLSMNGIQFEYERPYEVDTASPRHRQYQPDFFLPEHEIYIEHFALNEDGNPPPFWHSYGEGVDWKRNIHRQYGTRLIETYSWQCQQGVLQRELARSLRCFGVELTPVPPEDLLEQLKDMHGNWLSGILATSITHAKTSRVSYSELRNRAGASLRKNVFLDVFKPVLDRYEQLLADEGAADFEDLINRAADHIGDGNGKVGYRYVLVDEFQDISVGRMHLIAQLKRPGVAYFLVGDDWQSIYRFAGSDVRLVRGCGDYLGYVRERLLTTTFRYRPGILEPSTAFVQRNPEQTKRTLHSRSAAPDYGITVVAEESQELGVTTALEHIRCRTKRDGGLYDDYGTVSVFALGRYRRSQSVVKGRVEFSTIHRAKGREADFVLVLDLKNDHYGLPSQIDDDPLLDLVLPPRHSTAFPHAEERRLFYVAVTRARRGVYLITDDKQPSSFVEELLRSHLAIPRIGSGAVAQNGPVCARCGDRLVESQSGKNLRCVNYPLCRHLAPRCRACNHGHVVVTGGCAVCTNDSCGSPARACPRCGFGVLTRISGSRGSFFGCSEYRAEPPCEYKENIGQATTSPVDANRRDERVRHRNR